MRKIFLCAIVLIFNQIAFSQIKAKDLKQADFDKLVTLEDTINKLTDIVVNDTIDANRIAANAQLVPLVRKAMAISNSFNFAFEKIDKISITNSPDHNFRIFTWQLMINENKFKYFGFVQMNSSKPMFYELKDLSKDIQKPENQYLTTEKWFGALYYNIKPFKTKEGTKYLLFGFNSNDTIEKIKICDVLSLASGQPRFGAPVFETEVRGMKKTQNRLVLYHSFEASMRLNYDDAMDMVVHDHLEEIGYKNPAAAPYVSVPDGTYEAYKLEKGVWVHIDKLPTTVMDEAPTPKPILGNKAKVVDKENAKAFDWKNEEKKKTKN